MKINECLKIIFWVDAGCTLAQGAAQDGRREVTFADTRWFWRWCMVRVLAAAGFLTTLLVAAERSRLETLIKRGGKTPFSIAMVTLRGFLPILPAAS